MTLRSSDLQSDSDLDSIRNSCDVFLTQAVSFWDWAEDVKIQKDLVRILKTSGELDVKKSDRTKES